MADAAATSCFRLSTSCRVRGERGPPLVDPSSARRSSVHLLSAASSARAAAAESRAAAGNAVDAFSSAAVADAMRPSTAALERVDQLQRAVDALSDDVATLKRLDGGAVLRTWTEARLAELGSSGGPLSPRTRSDVESLKQDVATASAMTQQAMTVLESTADDLRDRVAKVVSGTAVTDSRLARCESSVSSLSRSSPGWESVFSNAPPSTLCPRTGPTRGSRR